MDRSAVLAAVLTLLCGMAFAQHAVEPKPAPAAEEAATVATSTPAPATKLMPAPQAEQRQAEAPPPVATPTPPAVHAQPAAPYVNVTFPSELDLYIIPAAAHSVHTTRDCGYGEIQTDRCMQPDPVGRGDPRLRSLCITSRA